jgi:hypothetical protein
MLCNDIGSCLCAQVGNVANVVLLLLLLLLQAIASCPAALQST